LIKGMKSRFEEEFPMYVFYFFNCSFFSYCVIDGMFRNLIFCY